MLLKNVRLRIFDASSGARLDGRDTAAPGFFKARMTDLGSICIGICTALPTRMCKHLTGPITLLLARVSPLGALYRF